jgi:acid stress-induced BolA-like protein IbaG/YrbA
MNKDTLEQALRELDFGDLDVRVIPEGLRFTAVVTTPDFTDMDEAERQHQVWAHLRQRFSDHELIRLEFIFTNSPDEDAAAE